MEVFFLLLGGCVLGAMPVYLVLQSRLVQARTEGFRAQQDNLKAQAESHKQQAQDQVDNARLTERLTERLAATVAEAERNKARVEHEIRAVTGERTQLQAAHALLAKEHAALSAQLEGERANAAEKVASLHQVREQMTNEFKVLATRIFDDNKKHFTEQSRSTLGELLDPLKVKLGEFQQKVEHVYDVEGKERRTISDELKHLREMNGTLSTEANNLTRALKGSTKTQGVWGELVLETVLEDSGLRKGVEYETQASHTREDGTRARPDVIIKLPESRHLIVDAKVSLTAYEEHATAESDIVREAALRRHIDSIRAHMKGLSAREYQTLYQLESLDFVLMFVAIEPAFMLAVMSERELFKEAWERNVILVSPSTLMFVLRTVSHLWRQEHQTRNTQEIARRGAALYDKLAGFVKELDNVGMRLGQAQVSFNDARAKLVTGTGSAIKQAEQLKELGVKPTKQLPLFIAEPGEDAANDNAPALSASPEA